MLAKVVHPGFTFTACPDKVKTTGRPLDTVARSHNLGTEKHGDAGPVQPAAAVFKRQFLGLRQYSFKRVDTKDYST